MRTRKTSKEIRKKNLCNQSVLLLPREHIWQNSSLRLLFFWSFCHLSEIIHKQSLKGGLISERFSVLSFPQKICSIIYFPQLFNLKLTNERLPLFVRTNDCPTKFSSKVDHNRSGQNGIDVAYLDFTTLQYVLFLFPVAVKHSFNKQLRGLKFCAQITFNNESFTIFHQNQ